MKNEVICFNCLGSHARKNCTGNLCFNCGESSHDRNKCDQKKGMKCKRCNRIGHHYSECNFIIKNEKDVLYDMDYVIEDFRPIESVVCCICQKIGHFVCLKNSPGVDHKNIPFLIKDGILDELFLKTLKFVKGKHYSEIMEAIEKRRNPNKSKNQEFIGKNNVQSTFLPENQIKGKNNDFEDFSDSEKFDQKVKVGKDSSSRNFGQKNNKREINVN